MHLAALALGLSSLPTLGYAQEAPAEEQSTSAIDKEKLELATQIVDLAFPEETREEVFFATVDQMTAQMREATLQAHGLEDDLLLPILDDWIAEYLVGSKVILRSHIPSLIDGMAKAYANMFSAKELADILAFVSTPSGQKFFELSSALIAEPNFANANQNYMNDVQAQLPAAIEDLQSRLFEALRARDEDGNTTSS
jgi:hypothetical protein